MTLALRRITRPLLGLAAAATLAISTILPAAAWQTSFTSEGCFAQGDSYAVGSSGYILTAAVQSGTYTPCNWTYVSGDFYVSGAWQYGLGPGWVSGGTASRTVANASSAVATHSACNPGGSCPNAAYGYSQF
ncbi:MAG: hypothetical protein WBO97_02180 [Tepidiformaceae bacterium]